MPPKKKVDLPDHVREAVLDDVHLSQRVAAESEASYKIRIYLATEQGLSTRELAEKLGVSQRAAANYAQQGQELYASRQEALRDVPTRDSGHREDPDRPGELISNGS